MSNHNEQSNTLTRQEYKGKIYVKNIWTNLCRIRNRIRIRNRLKSRIRKRRKLFLGPGPRPIKLTWGTPPPQGGRVRAVARSPACPAPRPAGRTPGGGPARRAGSAGTCTPPTPNTCVTILLQLLAYVARTGNSGHIIITLCCGSGSGIRCLFDPWIRDG